MSAYVDYCGEQFPLQPGLPITIGREGDIAIDDNPYLHRRFIEVLHSDGLLWLTNVGTAISATVADAEGLVQAWLSPGAHIPVVFERTAVWFTAGPTTYEFEVFNHEPKFAAINEETRTADGNTTLGRVSFTPDQRLLIVALAEDILRKNNRGGGAIPASKDAAERLGWKLTRFNRKLDNVCEKLTRMGVRGLHGGQGNNASNRRVRLVEYALASHLVSTEDLAFLDAISASE